MATYVFSDVHGHAATLDRLLERVQPGEGDRIFMLGDMIDRGPDPVGVLKTCRSLNESGACILMGNHEDLMLSYFEDSDDPTNVTNWLINGGATTSEGLFALPEAERIELLDWVANLPLYAYAVVEGRPYIMVHAGIRPNIRVVRPGRAGASGEGSDAEGASGRPGEKAALPMAMGWSEEDLTALLEAQSPEDLLWIRDAFWGHPTGLLDERGRGPIVIAGHTPTVYLEGMADRPNRSPVDEDGLCRMVRVGASAETYGVADRWDIDCGAAGGAGFGKLLMLRVDDEIEFYEPIREGE
ncbi:MAG: serine/threonine protein phosphatase [Olsenella sp.]|nr:serine/threonine protein phosphatase [Olsenella sp.]